MSETPLYPFKLNPRLHVKVWGGRQLSLLLKKPLPTDGPEPIPTPGIAVLNLSTATRKLSAEWARRMRASAKPGPRS